MILKHREKELLRFEWIEPQGVRIVSESGQNRILQIEECGEKPTIFLKCLAKMALQITANLKASPFVSYDELLELLGVPRRTIARRIEELTDAGKIRRIGALKNGYWEVL